MGPKTWPFGDRYPERTGPREGGMGNRVFAALYDPITRFTQRRFRPHREWLAADLSGSVLDLGAGTGAMFPYLCGRGLDLHAVEPDPNMRRRARRRADDLGCALDLREGRAEALPYPDGRFDAVVVSLVLCTVSDLAASVDEIARVLGSGGECRFLEHVRARSWRARLQERLTPGWRRVAGGCRLDRETPGAFLGHPDLTLETLYHTGTGVFPVTPVVRGRAIRA